MFRDPVIFLTPEVASDLGVTCDLAGLQRVREAYHRAFPYGKVPINLGPAPAPLGVYAQREVSRILREIKKEIA